MSVLARAGLFALLLPAVFAAPARRDVILDTVVVVDWITVTDEAGGSPTSHHHHHHHEAHPTSHHKVHHKTHKLSSSYAPLSTSKPAPTPPPVSPPVASSKAPASSSAYSALPSSTPGGKRGLAYNDPSATNPFSGCNKVKWAYNWASSSSAISSGLEYIPMLWGLGATSTWSSDASSAIASGSTALLGFNEPDNTGQSNIDPADAASAWQTYMQPFKGQAALGSPAVTNGGAPMGLTWLSNFFDSCTDCEVDFIVLHWYDSATNTQYFKDYISGAHAQFNKPIWITEFGASGSDDEVISFFQTVLPWLDSRDYVERYSYFWDGDGSLIDGDALSDYGQTYATL